MSYTNQFTANDNITATQMLEAADMLDTESGKRNLAFYLREASAKILISIAKTETNSTSVTTQATKLLDRLSIDQQAIGIRKADESSDLRAAELYALTAIDELQPLIAAASSLNFSSSNSPEVRAISNEHVNRLRISGALLSMIQIMTDRLNDKSLSQMRNLADDGCGRLEIAMFRNAARKNTLTIPPGIPNSSGHASTTTSSSSSSSSSSTTSSPNTTTTTSFGMNANDFPAMPPMAAATTPSTPSSSSPSSSSSSNSTSNNNNNIDPYFSFPLPPPNNSTNFSSASGSAGSEGEPTTTGDATTTAALVEELAHTRRQLQAAYEETARLHRDLAAISTASPTTSTSSSSSSPSMSSDHAIIVAELTATRKTLDEAREDMVQLRRQLDAANTHKARLGRELADAVGARNNLEQQLLASAGAREDLAHVQTQLSARETTIASLRAKLEAWAVGKHPSSAVDAETGAESGAGATPVSSSSSSSSSSCSSSSSSSSTTTTAFSSSSVEVDPVTMIRRLKGDNTALRLMSESELLELQETLGDSLKSIAKRFADIREEEKDQVNCIICMSAKKNTMLLPCAHLCVCDECAGVLLKNRQQNNGIAKCPICRAVVKEKKTAFF